MDIRRGEIYTADLTEAVGYEQGGYRPVLIIQNNKGNIYSKTVIVAPISEKTRRNFPTHVKIPMLSENSYVELEQIKTIDKRRLKTKLGKIDWLTQELVNNAIFVSLGI